MQRNPRIAFGCYVFPGFFHLKFPSLLFFFFYLPLAICLLLFSLQVLSYYLELATFWDRWLQSQDVIKLGRWLFWYLWSRVEIQCSGRTGQSAQENVCVVAFSVPCYISTLALLSMQDSRVVSEPVEYEKESFRSTWERSFLQLLNGVWTKTTSNDKIDPPIYVSHLI